MHTPEYLGLFWFYLLIQGGTYVSIFVCQQQIQPCCSRSAFANFLVLYSSFSNACRNFSLTILDYVLSLQMAPKFQMVVLLLRQQFRLGNCNRLFQPFIFSVELHVISLAFVSSLFEANFLDHFRLPFKLFFPGIWTTLSCFKFAQFVRLSFVETRTLFSFGLLAMLGFLAMFEWTRLPRLLASLLVSCNHQCHLTQSIFMSYVQSLWQCHWGTLDRNKLHTTPPCLSDHLLSCRLVQREEVDLTRLRLGTRLCYAVTHSWADHIPTSSVSGSGPL